MCGCRECTSDEDQQTLAMATRAVDTNDSLVFVVVCFCVKYCGESTLNVIRSTSHHGPWLLPVMYSCCFVCVVAENVHLMRTSRPSPWLPVLFSCSSVACASTPPPWSSPTRTGSPTSCGAGACRFAASTKTPAWSRQSRTCGRTPGTLALCSSCQKLSFTDC